MKKIICLSFCLLTFGVNAFSQAYSLDTIRNGMKVTYRIKAGLNASNFFEKD
jgi:hypothetical protein